MKERYIVWLVALILFIIPFFWLPSGVTDLGGDAGRLYFLDPLAVTNNLYKQQNIFGATIYAIIPYQFVLFLFSKIVTSPTYLIALEHGFQLSMSFFSIYLLVTTLLYRKEKNNDFGIHWIAITSGVVYVGFITKTGWVTSLETFNQVFLNPLIFYLLLKLLQIKNYVYGLIILFITFIFSENFGFSSSPQLFSFYPLAVFFLYLYSKFVLSTKFPWKRFFMLFFLYIGLHSFHLIPVVASILDKDSAQSNRIFSQSSIQMSGVSYFDENRQSLGKLSLELFQPANWNEKNIFILIIPLLAVIGFFGKKSRLLFFAGIFFLITFFLVSANITLLGVRIYRQLFYIPGFLMFRSFNEKWYYIFIFFYTILFSVSLHSISKRWKKSLIVIACFFIIATIALRIFPFLKGKFYDGIHYQSNNVTATFDLDPQLLESLEEVKKLPDDGNALTLPLTLPYFQVIPGKTTGAYVGVSMVRLIGGKDDYPGFWSFGPYKEKMLQLFAENDQQSLLQALSLLNVRYVFRDTTERIFNDFPKYPFYRYDMTTDIPAINNQETYDRLLDAFPLTTLFEKGRYRIQMLDKSVVRPTIYSPNFVYASQAGVLNGVSYRSAYLDEITCNTFRICDIENSQVPLIIFKKISPTEYTFTANISGQKNPFMIILLDDYHKSWNLQLNREDVVLQHLLVNGYANGWIIGPDLLQHRETIEGRISLSFQKYFFLGKIISILFGFLIIGSILVVFVKSRKK